ncbi:MAG TPA: hypothetical protein VEL74_09445 [Thermoanaerobaculia bacterium]|nr:hypothetical protein [Thermoanaerobaculia bacterium]
MKKLAVATFVFIALVSVFAPAVASACTSPCENICWRPNSCYWSCRYYTGECITCSQFGCGFGFSLQEEPTPQVSTPAQASPKATASDLRQAFWNDLTTAAPAAR